MATPLAGEAPNEYSVMIHWPAQTPVGNWVVHRRNGANPLALTQIAMVSGDQTSIEDTAVQAGETYTYFISVVDGENFELTEQVAVEIPRDLVIEGVRRDLHDIRGFNRLFMKEGSVIVTGAEGLTVRVKEFHSASGIIETFSREERSSAPTRGLNAGAISIHADAATGTLGVVSIGQSGGNGVDGLPGAKGATGFKGDDGEWGANPVLYERGYNREQIEHTVRRMKERLPPCSDHNWKNIFGSQNDPNFACIHPPTDGRPGEPGQPGTPGTNGSDGGNSAYVYIEVRNGTGFVVDQTIEGGRPGAPGKGAAGGLGGSGGEAGKLDRGCLCPRGSKRGRSGPKGVDGAPGIPGRYGLKEPFCLKVNGIGSEGCKHFKNEGTNQ